MTDFDPNATAARRLRLLDALHLNPDKRAEDRNIGMATGTPIGLVDDNIRRQYRVDQMDAQMQGLSVLPDAVRKSETFATLAQDDLETLASLEKVTKARQRRANAIAAAIRKANERGWVSGMLTETWGNVRKIPSAIWANMNDKEIESLRYTMQVLDQQGKLTPEGRRGYEEDIRRHERQRDASLQKIRDINTDIAAVAPTVEPNIFQKMVRSAVTSAPYSVGALAVSLATRNPFAGPAAMGYAVGETGQSEARIDGLDYHEAARKGAIDGVAEAAFEILPMTHMLALFGRGAKEAARTGGKEALKTFGKAAASDVIGENATQVVQDMNNLFHGLDPELQKAIDEHGLFSAEVLKIQSERQLIASGSSLITSVAMGGPRLVATMKQNHEADLTDLDATAEAVRNSRTRERAPDVFDQYVRDLVEDSDLGDIYADGNALHQDGLDEALAEALPERAEEIRAAVENGGAVQIPLEDYLSRIAPNEELTNALRPHIRDADGMSAQELENHALGELEQDIRNEVTRLATEDTRAAEIQAIEQSIIEQLNTAGQTTEEANRTYATLYTANVDVFSRQMGLSPQEYHAQYGIHIAGGNIVIRTQAGEQTLTPAEAARRLAAGAEAAVQSGQQDTGTVPPPTPAGNNAAAQQNGQPLSTAEVLRRWAAGEEKALVDSLRKQVGELGTTAFDARIDALEAQYNSAEADALPLEIHAYARANGYTAQRTGNGIGQFEWVQQNAQASSQNSYQQTTANTAQADEFAATAKQYGGEAAYEQAKVAGETELDYRQWIQVRTPSFKAWFGDWETARDLNVDSPASKDSAEATLKALAGKALTNNETGLTAYVNRDQRGKMLSAAARRKSGDNGFSSGQHYALAQRIEQLWRHATFVGEFMDTKHGDANVRIKRFAAPVRMEGSTHYVAILAKENIAATDGQRIYTLELHTEETLRSTLGNLLSQQAESISPIRSADDIIGALEAKVNPDAGSKVVNPQTGEPQVVYHGTGTQFDTFEPSYPRFAPGNINGIYFTDVFDEEMREVYGENQYAVFLNVRNLLEESPRRYIEKLKGVELPVPPSEEKMKAYRAAVGNVDDIKKSIQDAGFDGVKNRFGGGHEYIVFHSNQIKSATGNSGAFDAANPNIYYQQVWHGTPYRGIENEGFDLGRIGSGEGAQAYGWGIYFAGDREISEWYRKKLSDSEEVVNFRYGDEPYIHTNNGWISDEHGWQLEGAEEVAANAITDGTDLEALIAEAEEDEMDVIWDGHRDVDLNTAREAAQMIADGAIEADTRQGQLYSAEIPENGELLDWDDAYSKQPQEMQEKIRSTIENAPQRALEDYGVETGQELADKILGNDPTGSNIYSALSDIYGDDREASLALNDNGIPGLRYFDGNSRSAGEGSHNYVIWDENLLDADTAQIETYYQREAGPRGAFSPDTNTITLTPNADLSTFIHELGHYFLETLTRHATELRARNDAGEALTAGQQQIIKDADTILANLGVPGLDSWHSMSLEEKRSHHELAARQFETYILEGKAPSLELQGAFQRFRAWLLRIYKAARNLNAPLNDDVRQVFDRLLATEEAIELAEQNRSMMQLFASPEEAGMTPEQFAEYQQQGRDATQAAQDEMQARALRDTKYIRNLRNKALRRKQQEAKAARQQAEMQARQIVLGQPVYRVWQFLSGTMNPDTTIAGNKRAWTDAVDPAHDDLNTAIAKLGGLNREAVEKEWGLDPQDRIPDIRPGFPVLRRNGGLSVDGMRQALVEQGYLNDSDSLNDFYAVFDAQQRGQPQYSHQHQPDPGSGKAGEHAHLHDLPTLRLDREALLELGYSEAQIKQLGRKVSKTGGVHPDLVAELFQDEDGNALYDSGDAMVQALLAAKRPQDAINDVADDIMLQQFGELATPQAVALAADMAVHNDIRLRVIASEANALAKAVGNKTLLNRAARQLAQETIAAKRLRDIHPAQYTRMEARAAKAAALAQKKGDIATAAAEKRNQLLQAHLARAAYEAQEEAATHLRYLKRMNRLNPKNIDIKQREQIEAILERYNLREQTKKALDRTQSLGQWVEEQRQQGFEPNLSAKTLDELQRMPWQHMNLTDLRGLVADIKQIEYAGKRKKQLFLNQQWRDYNATVEEAVAGIKANARRSGIENRTPTTPGDIARNAAEKAYFAHLRPNMQFREMDGNRDNGPMYRIFTRPTNERANWQTQERARATEVMNGHLQPLLKRRDLNSKRAYSIGGKTRSFTPTNIFAIALNYGNESNAQRMRDGEHWTDEEIKQLVGVLTAEELHSVQAIWDEHENYYKPKIAEVERRTTGVEPEWVEARPFTVTSADGQTVTLRGGYYPLRYDNAASVRTQQTEDAITSEHQQAVIAVRRGFTKSRVTEVHDRPLVYDLSGIYSGLDEVIHYLAWHEWSIDIGRLLRSKRLSDAIRDSYGDNYYQQLVKWARDISAGDLRQESMLVRGLNRIRKYGTPALLGYNLMSATMQPLGLLQTAARIGTVSTLNETLKYLGNPLAIVQKNREANEASVFMANRSKTQMRELNELYSQMMSGNRAKRAQNWMLRNSYVILMLVQKQVDVITWHAARNKALEEGQSNEDAVGIADQAVIDTQGSGMTKDLSAIERDGYGKAFTVFYSYMNAILNLEHVALRSKDSIAKKAEAVILLSLGVPILSAMFRSLLKPGDSDDWDKDNWWRTIGREIINHHLGLFALTREFQIGRFDYKGPVGLHIFADAGKFVNQLSQGEFDKALLKAGIGLLGATTGIPSAAINRIVDGLDALQSGETDNPAVLLYGQDR